MVAAVVSLNVEAGAFETLGQGAVPDVQFIIDGSKSAGRSAKPTPQLSESDSNENPNRTGS